MDKKKDTMDKPKIRVNILIALYIAVILLGIEAIRYFIEIIAKSIGFGEIVAYWIGLGIAIIALAILIKGFSD